MKVNKLIRELKKKDSSIVESDTSGSDYISLQCVTNKGKKRKFLEIRNRKNGDITILKCEKDTFLSVRTNSKVVKAGVPINKQVYFDNDVEEENIVNIAVASYEKVKSRY